MNVVVRPFSPSDASACAAIVDATPLWQRYGLEGAKLAEQLIETNEPVLVADADGRFAGFAWMLRRGGFGRSPYLRLIAVDPALRGQGVGEQLLKRFELLAKLSGKDAMLLVSDFNTGAQRFYKREGYVEVGRLDDFVIPGVAELIFRKRLK